MFFFLYQGFLAFFYSLSSPAVLEVMVRSATVGSGLEEVFQKRVGVGLLKCNEEQKGVDWRREVHISQTGEEFDPERTFLQRKSVDKRNEMR